MWTSPVTHTFVSCCIKITRNNLGTSLWTCHHDQLTEGKCGPGVPREACFQEHPARVLLFTCTNLGNWCNIWRSGIIYLVWPVSLRAYFWCCVGALAFEHTFSHLLPVAHVKPGIAVNPHRSQTVICMRAAMAVSPDWLYCCISGFGMWVGAGGWDMLKSRCPPVSLEIQCRHSFSDAGQNKQIMPDLQVLHQFPDGVRNRTLESWLLAYIPNTESHLFFQLPVLAG